MKVLNLRCANGHGFEGWFASEDDFMDQNHGALIECPLCADKVITRLPSAPRLNLSGARAESEPAPKPDIPAQLPAPADLQAAWLATVRQMMAQTQDVGTAFAEEARRIHYGEVEPRPIRGQATAEERRSLQDEGIETVSILVPKLLEGPLQ
jgi:hypothetical protein